MIIGSTALSSTLYGTGRYDKKKSDTVVSDNKVSGDSFSNNMPSLIGEVHGKSVIYASGKCCWKRCCSI